MKIKLMVYYFAFAAITFGLFGLEKSNLSFKGDEEVKSSVETLERRPIEPNGKPEEKEQVDTKRSRPNVSFRSNQIC